MTRFRWFLALVYLLFIGVLLAFPYGPLFPWSAWKPGYEKLELGRADVYYGTGQPLPDAYRHVDQYIREAELFHRLRMPARVTVIACRDWSDFHRFVPWVGSAVGAVTLLPGDKILVTPKIAERKLDYAEFLRHELSHSALNQNQSPLHGFQMEGEPWLYEGIAVLFGRQKAYEPWSVVRQKAQEIDFVPLIDRPASRPVDMRLFYPVARYFLEYWIETQGRDRFQKLLVATMAEPAGCRRHFHNAYGLGLDDAIRQYQKAVREGAWKPSE